MRQHQDIEPATTYLMERLHSSPNRKERTTLVNIRTLTMVSARCQVHLGMLAKANKFSRVLALQNCRKGDGMSKKSKNTTRKQQTFSCPFAFHKRPNQPGTKPMFCVSAVHSKAALLNWIKRSLRTETCAHTCQGQFTLESTCAETNTYVCDIVSAPWNNGKEVLKWHKFASCATTLVVKNQNARASHWEVECKGRWLRTAIHTTALQNFATEPCVVPFPGLLSKPVDRNTHFADASVACLQSRQ